MLKSLGPGFCSLQLNLDLSVILGKHGGSYRQTASEKVQSRRYGTRMGTQISSFTTVLGPRKWIIMEVFFFFFFFWPRSVFSKDPPSGKPRVLGHLSSPRLLPGENVAFISWGACPGFHASLSNPLLSCPPKIHFLSFGFLFCFLILIPRTFS